MSGKPSEIFFYSRIPIANPEERKQTIAQMNPDLTTPMLS
jgi:hypothetical protein